MERDSFCSQLKHISGAWIKFVVHLLKHIRGAWLKLGFSFKYYTFIHLWKTIFFLQPPSTSAKSLLFLYSSSKGLYSSFLKFLNFVVIFSSFFSLFLGFWLCLGLFWMIFFGKQGRTTKDQLVRGPPTKIKKKSFHIEIVPARTVASKC